MSSAVTLGVALVAAFLAWKVFAGIIKMVSIVAIMGAVGYFYWQGII